MFNEKDNSYGNPIEIENLKYNTSIEEFEDKLSCHPEIEHDGT